MLPPDRPCGFAPLHPLPTQQTPVSLGGGVGQSQAVFMLQRIQATAQPFSAFMAL